MSQTSELLSILILTRNEEVHIARCLESAFKISNSVYVLDSNSTDKTSKIVSGTTARLISRDFITFAEKLNWGLKNIEFQTPWVMRIDADEVLTEEFIAKLYGFLRNLDEEITGIYVRRQIWFLGRWIRFGGMYPTFSMRIVKPEAAFCESRDLDEHMILRSGRHAIFKADIIDNPLTSLSDWISKHNNYAVSEAKLAIAHQPKDASEGEYMDILGTLPQRVRWVKSKVFYRLPPLLRPILYFIYRYFLRLGFLDGRAGFVFHFMHGLWYRLLVDANILSSVTKGARKHEESAN